MPRARSATAAVLVATLATGCGPVSQDPAVRVGSPSPAGGPSASASSGSVPSPAVAQQVTLAFAGDVHFTGRTAKLLEHPDTAIGPFAAHLSAADIAVVNLETAITIQGTPEPKEFHFRAPATAYAALRAAGVDIASLGNNHALDYGRVGLADTLAAAQQAGMAVIGAGLDADHAYAAHLITVHGVRVAVLAMSQIHTLAAQWAPTATRSGIAMAHDVARTVRAVREAKQLADAVVVYLHWGVERSNCPKAEMRDLAEALAGAGATMIVGTHAHVPLAAGIIGDTYVHYGLGNFVWYVGNADTIVLTVTVTAVPGSGTAKVTKAKVTPGVVSSTGQPKPVTGAAAKPVLDRLAQAQRCSGLPSFTP